MNQKIIMYVMIYLLHETSLLKLVSVTWNEFLCIAQSLQFAEEFLLDVGNGLTMLQTGSKLMTNHEHKSYLTWQQSIKYQL